MICVSVQERNFERCCSIARQAEMIELRLDLTSFSECEVAEIIAICPRVLVTCRIENVGEEQAMHQLKQAVLAGASLVDVEIEAPDWFMEELCTFAKAHACSFIISYHNFTGTDTLPELEAIYVKSVAKGADIVKIVTTATTITDATRTLSLYKSTVVTQQTPRPLLAFSMGAIGQFTRKQCLDFGAPYTYVAYDKTSATAPGQYTLKEMKQLLDAKNYPNSFSALTDEVWNARLQEVQIPCSKSVAQRAILAAALSDGVSVLHNFAPCNDINGAIAVVESLGAKVQKDGDTLRITGVPLDQFKQLSRIQVGESGLLTRLLLPFAAYLSGINGNSMEISGHGSILKRNLSESILALRAAGSSCKGENGTPLEVGDAFLPLCVEGGITEETITFSGTASSQIVSGFLMTLPLLSHDSTLIINAPTSIPYIELTLKTLSQFGIVIRKKEASAQRYVFTIPGNQRYVACEIQMDADWSSASFFAVAGAIHGSIRLLNMSMDSFQADEAILSVLTQCGVKLNEESTHSIQITHTLPLKPFTFDATNAPDLFPILAVLALHCEGESRIKGVSRLAQKESNRAESIFSELSVLGGDIRIDGDMMYICGSKLHGGRVRSHNDHRIAMSVIVASFFIPTPVELDDVRCIDKSFPSFISYIK